jgi:hypothetical protein
VVDCIGHPVLWAVKLWRVVQLKRVPVVARSEGLVIPVADRNDGQGQGAFAYIANRQVPKLNVVESQGKGARWEFRGNGSGLFLSM